jgi:hypothetical protein
VPEPRPALQHKQAVGAQTNAHYIAAKHTSGRFNNQRLMLSTLLLLGRLLNRTVVLPPAPQLSEYFDLPRLSMLHPIVSGAEVPRAAFASNATMGIKANTVLFLTRAAMEHDASQKEWWTASAGSVWKPRFVLDEFSSASSSPAGQSTVLLFDWPYPKLQLLFGGFPSDLYSSMELWLMDALRLQPFLYQMAEQVKAAIRSKMKEEQEQTLGAAAASAATARRQSSDSPPLAPRDVFYLSDHTALAASPHDLFDASIHLRTGDYTRGLFSAYLRSLPDSVAWALRVTRGVVDRPPRVYIAAEPDQLLDNLTRELQGYGMDVWTWARVRELRALHGAVAFPSLSHRLLSDTNTVGMLEVLLLTSARSFLPTVRSTVSNFVLLLRTTQPSHRLDALRARFAWNCAEAQSTSAKTPLPLPFVVPTDTPLEGLPSMAAQAAKEREAGEEWRKPLVRDDANITRAVWIAFLTPLQR